MVDETPSGKKQVTAAVPRSTQARDNGTKEDKVQPMKICGCLIWARGFANIIHSFIQRFIILERECRGWGRGRESPVDPLLNTEPDVSLPQP